MQARAEDLAGLNLPAARLVTFGQSIHWTDRQLVLAMVHDLLEVGGAVALIAPALEHGAPPDDPPAPPIPHDEIEALLGRYLGWSRSPRVDTYEASLEDSPFGASASRSPPVAPTSCARPTKWSPATCPCPSPHPIGSVIAWTRSWPKLTALLTDVSPAGLFHDWPGDTAIIWATKNN